MFELLGDSVMRMLRDDVPLRTVMSAVCCFHVDDSDTSFELTDAIVLPLGETSDTRSFALLVFVVDLTHTEKR